MLLLIFDCWNSYFFPCFFIAYFCLFLYDVFILLVDTWFLTMMKYVISDFVWPLSLIHTYPTQMFFSATFKVQCLAFQFSSSSFSHSSFALAHSNFEYHSYLVHVQLIISKCPSVDQANVWVSGQNLNIFLGRSVAKIIFLAAAFLSRERYISFAPSQESINFLSVFVFIKPLCFVKIHHCSPLSLFPSCMHVAEALNLHFVVFSLEAALLFYLLSLFYHHCLLQHQLMT